MNQKQTYKEELIKLFTEKFPQLGPSFIVMLELDIPSLQVNLNKCKNQATIHPRMVLELLDTSKYDELRTIAEHSYSFHRASNLLNQYLGNTIE